MNDTAKADPVRALVEQFLRDRDEALTPDDYSDAERAESARLIAEQVQAALAQQAGAEPFAYLQSADLVGIEASKKLHSGAVFTAATKASSSFDLPLYTTPQPAIPEGAFPMPRTRSEAASLAKQALAYLGVIDAHIDAAIARCETDAQHNK